MAKELDENEIYKNLSLESLPGEVWRDVVGYEGKYLVSNLGRVKAVGRFFLKKDGVPLTLKEKTLSQSINECGYLRITLVDNDGKQRSKTTHRLVAKAFIPNPENKREVNHKIPGFENKVNNCEWNLEWTTSKENKIHAVENGIRIGSGCPSGKIPLNADIVILARKLKAEGRGFAEIARHLDMLERTTTIKAAILGKTWKWLKPSVEDLLSKKAA